MQSKYELKGFQLKAKAAFKNTLNLLEYEDILKKLKDSPYDSQAQKESLKGRNGNEFVIQINAPTGSGKTVLIGNIVDEFFKDYVHILFSPGSGDLEEQTARRLSEILGESRVHRIESSLLSYDAQPGETYVGNWEQFVSRNKATGEYKNRIAREGDNVSFFDWVSNIGSKFIPVVITIDEAHYGARASSAIQSFLADITTRLGYSPLIIEASATNIFDNHLSVNIDRKDVIDAGLMRRSIKLNNESLISEALNKLTPEQLNGSFDIEKLLLDKALEQQALLNKEYIRVGASVVKDGEKIYYRSLIGIQVPNGIVGNGLIQRIETYLNEKGISKENKRLAIYLANDKTDNMDDIQQPWSPVDVLIYKQGIATGWDCPRAQILVGYRHITSKVFTTQNLGRFLRTTEAKHYGNVALDTTYVFSNVGTIGDASWGDDVDENYDYILETKLDERNGHVALSSFNDLQLPQSKYSYTNQNVVDPKLVRQAWVRVANNPEAPLWKQLTYGTVDLRKKSLLSTELDSINIEDGFGVGKSSKLFTLTDAEIEEKYRSKIFEIIKNSNRDFGNIGQVSRLFANLIASWYCTAVIKDHPGTDKFKTSHYGKLNSVKDIVEAETTEAGKSINNIDWKLIAYTQLAYIINNLEAISKSLKESLEDPELNSTREENGEKISWATREVVSEDPFSIPQDTIIEISKKGVLPTHLESYYALKPLWDEERYLGTDNLSGPETKFLDFIKGLVETEENKQTWFLQSFYKSPENMIESYHTVVKIWDHLKEKETDSLTMFYPDWFLELTDNSGDYLPCLLETKSYNNVRDADGKLLSIIAAKALFLIELSRKIKNEKGLKLKAGIVYQDGDVWKIITKVNLTTGRFTSEDLNDYLQNQLD